MRKQIVAWAVMVLIGAVFLATQPVSCSATENSWVSKAPLPDNISAVKTAVVDGKIYAMNDTSNFEYDPAANIWTQKTFWGIQPNSRSPEMDFGMVSCGGKIYVLGGGGTNVQSGEPFYFSSNHVYDPSTDSWQTKAPMPTARTRVEAASVDGKIYVIGGINNDGGYMFSGINVTEIYDPASDTWTQGMSAPLACDSAPCVGLDGKIYIFGAKTNRTVTMIYDTQTNAWSFGASAPVNFGIVEAGATSGIFAPKSIFILAAEFTNETKFNDTDYRIASTLEVYDPALGSWSNISTPISRSNNAMAVVNDTLHIIGGSGSWHPYDLYSNWKAATQTSQVDQYFPIGYSEKISDSQETPVETLILGTESNLISLVLIATGIVVIVLIGSLLIYARHRKQVKKV